MTYNYVGIYSSGRTCTGQFSADDTGSRTACKVVIRIIEECRDEIGTLHGRDPLVRFFYGCERLGLREVDVR